MLPIALPENDVEMSIGSETTSCRLKNDRRCFIQGVIPSMTLRKYYQNTSLSNLDNWNFALSN